MRAEFHFTSAAFVNQDRSLSDVLNDFKASRAGHLSVVYRETKPESTDGESSSNRGSGTLASQDREVRLPTINTPPPLPYAMISRSRGSFTQAVLCPRIVLDFSRVFSILLKLSSNGMVIYNLNFDCLEELDLI